MRLSIVTSLVLSVWFLSGCTYFVHPILRDSDLTTDVDLSGSWALKSQDSDRHDWSKFSVQSIDGGANYRGALGNGTEFAARIGKLGDQRYLEFSIVGQPVGPPAGKPALLSSVPVIAIARFEASGDTLRVFPVGHNRAIPCFDKHDIPYRLIESGVKHYVLTADTPTLQNLLTDHSDQLFSDSAITFTRKPSGTSRVSHTESETRLADVDGGKSFDEWIAQAKQGRRLKDREDALQTLRNFGLRHDREKTLRAFTQLLSDKAPTVRSLAAAGLWKAGRPTDPKAAAQLVEIISRDLSEMKFPKKGGEVGGEFGGVMRAIAALEVIGETIHVPALKQVSENATVDSIIRQTAAKAVDQIERRSVTSTQDKKQADAIRKIEFLVGTWQSVEPTNASPATETRTIIVQPDGLSLTLTTESVVGKGRPVHVTFDLESQEYLLTHTNANGETRVFRAKLTADGKLTIPVPESTLFSGLNFIVEVNDGKWTESVTRPSQPDEALYQRTFARQQLTALDQ